MQERIVELISIVLQELKNNIRISDIDINSLLKQGFTNSEISTAFSWLVDRIEFDNSFISGESENQESFRMLHDAEKELFDKDGWGFIIQLKTLGIMTTQQVENLIENLMSSGIIRADKRFLKKYIWNQILNENLKIEEGSRLILKGNELIN